MLITILLILTEVLIIFLYQNYFLSFGSVVLHILSYGVLVGKVNIRTNKYSAIFTIYIVFLIVRIMAFKFETTWLISHVVYLLYIIFLFSKWIKSKPNINFKIDWKSEYRFQWYIFGCFVIFMIIYTIIDLKELGKEYDLLENNIKVEAIITDLSTASKKEISVDYVYSVGSEKYKRERVTISKFANGHKQVGDTLMITVALEDNSISRIPYEYRDDWKDIIR